MVTGYPLQLSVLPPRSACFLDPPNHVSNEKCEGSRNVNVFISNQRQCYKRVVTYICAHQTPAELSDCLSNCQTAYQNVRLLIKMSDCLPKYQSAYQTVRLLIKLSDCLPKYRSAYQTVRLLIKLLDCLSKCQTAYQILLTTSKNL